MVSNQFINDIENLVGSSSMLLGDDVGDQYSVDVSGENALIPELVLRPVSTHQLSDILRCCVQHNQRFVIQGGMTGVSGGATPQKGEVAISIQLLKGITEIDELSMTMTVKAGTTLEEIQLAAIQKGLMFPLDFGSRGSCTIGGIVATNAGGNQVIKYGAARSHILGLEVVLADGTVLSSLDKVLKNNTGYDLKQLFIGSEGTLGIVTQVVLRLQPLMESVNTAFCALETFDAVTKFFRGATKKLAGKISAFEVMWNDYYHYVLTHSNEISPPFTKESPFYVLIETEDSEGSHIAIFEEFLESELEEGIVVDAVMATNSRQRRDLWRIREGIGEVVGNMGPVANVDISIPLSQVKQFIDSIHNRLERQFPGVQILTFGHLGDGNLHITAGTGRDADKEGLYRTLFEESSVHGGVVSGEHGLGVLKSGYIHLSRSETEITLMKQLKKLLDPNGLLNVGRVIQ